jgi:hypothetical protein
LSALLRKAVDALASEGMESDTAFELVAPALHEFGEDDLAERVLVAAPDSAWEGIAAFLNIASWDVSPAAETMIFRTAEAWLKEADDIRRVQIALHLDVIPFSQARCDPGLLETVLARVAVNFPGAAPRCEYLLAQARHVRARAS